MVTIDAVLVDAANDDPAQRQEVRRLVTRTMKLVDYEDAALFPLPKKPHVYYW